MQSDAVRFELEGISDANGQPVVGPVSLCWPQPGAACTLIGETGSGKSLVGQSVLGLLPRDFVVKGWLEAEGRRIPLDDVAQLHALWARILSLVPQEPRAALDPTMRLRAQMRHVRGGSDRAIDAALTELDMSTADTHYPFQLSGGMAQRALFATALIGQASLIIADEPTKGLDGRRAQQSLDALQRLRAEGRRLLVITHDLALARQLGGSVTVLRSGNVVETAAAEPFFTQPRSDYAQQLLAADPRHWHRRNRAASTGAPVAELRNVTFGYGPQPLFEAVTIRVQPGQVAAICGDSGVGKTTLGDIMLGLHRPDTGSVFWQGDDIHARRGLIGRMRRRFQKMHQDPGAVFARHRTVGAHFDDLRDLVSARNFHDRLNGLLDSLKLRTSLLQRTVDAVSGGEAQRLALARILLLDPLLIVADEPSSRLDPIVQKEMFELLTQSLGRATAMLLISHDRALIDCVADSVTALER